MSYNILMLANSLDIGGAETHIVELAKALKRRGFGVYICSAGGRFVQTIEQCGITHIPLPLNSKADILYCAVQIQRIISKYKIDVVHSHARIPSLAACIACKRTPLAVTVHYNFSTSPLSLLLTRWGDAQIAVSPDLQKYLTDNYNVASESITLTVNGIDTEKFCDNADCSAVCDEFGISESNFVLLCVCRMDMNACKSVFDTLDIALELDKIISGLKIVVIGSGDALERVRNIAAELNKEAQRKLVLALGARADIAAFCARADAFVGVSRAALEAMACGTPVILAGNQGFSGLFNPALKDIYRKTNFTLRGFGESEPQKIYNELVQLYRMSDKDKTSLCDIQRRLVTEEYSTEIMADDAVKAYKRAEKSKYYDFLVCGYYGYDNIGDDSMLSAVVKSLKLRLDSPSIAVLTKDGAMPRGVEGVHTVDRFDLLAVLAAIRKSRVVMFGGGNLLQDTTSKRSLSYYLMLLKAAHLFSKKTMLYANGIGPLSSENTPSVVKVLKKVDLITAREADTYEFLKNLDIDCHLTADEVFAVDDNTVSPLADGENYALISLRVWSRLDDGFAVKLSDVLNRLYEKHGIKSVFACLQDSVDLPVCAALSPLVEGSQVLDGLDGATFSALVKNSRFVVGMRLHSLVYACREAVPAICISYDGKVDAFAKHTGNPYILQASQLDTHLLEQYIENVLADTDRDELQKTSAQMKALALQNSQLAKELLERK